MVVLARALTSYCQPAIDAGASAHLHAGSSRGRLRRNRVEWRSSSEGIENGRDVIAVSYARSICTSPLDTTVADLHAPVNLLVKSIRGVVPAYECDDFISDLQRVCPPVDRQPNEL